MAMQARKAVRQQVKVKVALIGPSGSGKTYSALRLAKGFGGRVLLGNTEGDRGYLYADEFEYDIIDLTPPYSPERYIELMTYAENEGYDTLIIDSGSHEWAGRGGILETLDNMPGNSSFAKWKTLTPRHNAFVDKMLYSKIHIINCLRAKDQYVVEENDKGKQQPKKVGAGAQQRDNYEYEFMVTLMIEMQTHIPAVMKDNTHLFENRFEVLTEEHGKMLKDWAEKGMSAPPVAAPPAATPPAQTRSAAANQPAAANPAQPAPQPPMSSPEAKPPGEADEPMATEPQIKMIYAKAKSKGHDAKEILLEKYGFDSTKLLTKKQASEFIEYLDTVA